MGAGGGDDDRAFDRFLAVDFGEIDGRRSAAQHALDVGRGLGAGLDLAVEEADDFGDGAHAEDLDAGDDRGLGGVLGGDDDASEPARLGECGHGDGAFDGPDAPVKGELAREQERARVDGLVLALLLDRKSVV